MQLMAVAVVCHKVEVSPSKCCINGISIFLGERYSQRTCLHYE